MLALTETLRLKLTPDVTPRALSERLTPGGGGSGSERLMDIADPAVIFVIRGTVAEAPALAVRLVELEEIAKSLGVALPESEKIHPRRVFDQRRGTVTPCT